MYTKSQLIEKGFLPSAARAKMKIPFAVPLGCTQRDYPNLPKEIQEKYEANPTGPVHMLLKEFK